MRRRTGPTVKVRRAVMERDGNRCMSCSSVFDLVVNHRVNRGMGGSRLYDTPEYLTTACTFCNGAYEDRPNWAREYGWKLRRADSPTTLVFSDFDAGWFRLTPDGGRVRAEAVA